MTREQWAFIIGLFVMLVMCASYFFKTKSVYLSLQGTGIVLLMVSYALQGEFFAMVGLVIGLFRSVVYLWYAWKNKNTPLWWAFVFSALGVVAYLIINLGILHTAKPFDMIYLVGLCCYAFIFRIRDLALMKYLVLIPTGLSIAYNILIAAVPFVVVSYGFEFCANIVAIVKQRFDKKKAKGEENGQD